MSTVRLLKEKDHGMGPGIPDIFDAAARDDIDALEIALQHFDVNSQDANLMTPLHHAAGRHSERAVDRILKEKNLDATKKDRFGRNASDVVLEVFGERGAPLAQRLHPYCYPEVFAEIEAGLRNDSGP